MTLAPLPLHTPQTRPNPLSSPKGPAYLDIDLSRSPSATTISTAMARHPFTVALRPNLLLTCDQGGWAGTFSTTVRHLFTDLLGEGPVLTVLAYEAPEREPGRHGGYPHAAIISDTVLDITGTDLVLAKHPAVSYVDETLLGMAL